MKLFEFMCSGLAWYLIIHICAAAEQQPVQLTYSNKLRQSNYNASSITTERFTIRVNTFRRNDQLITFLKEHHKCPVVYQIQIVWSDTENRPPKELQDAIKDGSYSKAIFEIHTANSLSNRFKPLLPIKTEAVFSVDDDIAISCEDLIFLMQAWQSNTRALVGISPRLSTHDAISGDPKYLHWQHTWWNGMYSIMLTKAAMMHRDYLELYFKHTPQSFLTYIDTHRNCEDLAMAFLVAQQSQRPPVWVSLTFYDTGAGGISSGTSHFDIRGECVKQLEAIYKVNNLPVGYQKVERLSWWNTLPLLFDFR